MLPTHSQNALVSLTARRQQSKKTPAEIANTAESIDKP